jgi:hypothetical protein
MRPELTDKQRQAMEEQPGRPVEVVDPSTQRAYVLIPREEYERLRSLPGPSVEVSGPQLPEEAGLFPAGIRRSQEALRRALPQLLRTRPGMTSKV